MSILAHASGNGWDEMAMAVAPFVVGGVIFVLARRSAGVQLDEAVSTSSATGRSEGSSVV